MPLQFDKLNMLLFFLVGYAVWIVMFGIQRYLVVIELLSGLVIFLLLELIINSSRYRTFIFIPIALLMIVTTVPANYGRVSWGPSWFDVNVPSELTAQNEMFIMLTTEPYSYVIPSFPADSRFVRIESNLDPSKTRFDTQIRQAIADHKGPIYSIGIGVPDERQLKLLASYGLVRSDMNNISITSKVHSNINICRLIKQ